MNVQDLIDQIGIAVVRDGADLHTECGDRVNLATFTEHTEILEEIGDDLALDGHAPDLSAGWTRVREQLAFNAVYLAVSKAIASGRYDDAREDGAS